MVLVWTNGGGGAPEWGGEFRYRLSVGESGRRWFRDAFDVDNDLVVRYSVAKLRTADAVDKLYR